MSTQVWKEALPNLPGIENLTMSYAPNGNQILHIGDLNVEVGPMASIEEVWQAIAKPTVQTRNTKITMNKPWQGLAQKVGKLVHDAEAHAAKISARVDAVGPRMETAANKVHAVIDGHEADVKDIEDFANQMEAVTNGGPPLGAAG